MRKKKKEIHFRDLLETFFLSGLREARARYHGRIIFLHSLFLSLLLPLPFSSLTSTSRVPFFRRQRPLLLPLYRSPKWLACPMFPELNICTCTALVTHTSRRNIYMAWQKYTYPRSIRLETFYECVRVLVHESERWLAANDNYKQEVKFPTCKDILRELCEGDKNRNVLFIFYFFFSQHEE